MTTLTHVKLKKAQDRQDRLDLALKSAVSRSDLEGAKKAIKKGANAKQWSDDRRSLLHTAALQGDLQLVKMLLEEGVKVNCTGFTPLMAAAIGAAPVEVFDALLEAGANINATYFRANPLSYLEQKTQTENVISAYNFLRAEGMAKPLTL